MMADYPGDVLEHPHARGGTVRGAKARLTLNRRRFLQVGAGALAAFGFGGLRVSRAQALASAFLATARPLPTYAEDLGRYPFALPDLGYAYGALEPTIDAETMELHHQAHHQSYVDELNAALEGYPELHDLTLGELLTTLPELPEEVHQDVQNQGGGHLNHALWWRWVEPGGSREPVGRSAELIAATFGDLEGLK
jgi:Fe-Mn family superoxide dismutase